MAKLRKFLYLDTSALGDYVSGLEGGKRESLERKISRDKHGEGKVAFKAVEGSVGGSRASEESLSYADTPQAQFQRLMDLIREDEEEADWVDVVNPDIDLPAIGIGALIDVECELYVPPIIKALSSEGGILGALDTLDALLPFMRTLQADVDQDVRGLPTQSEREAFRGVVGAMGSKLIAVGEFDASDWRIAGQLLPEFTKGEIEGPARVTGKIAAKVAKGQRKSLLALPGFSLLSREQRRELERKKPNDDEKDQYLEGPALMLDVLAIYR